MVLNKSDLVDDIAGRSGVSKKDIDNVVKALFESVGEALSREEKVQLVGFGTFEVRHRQARTGRNPATKEIIEIPATKVPVFKPGKSLKEQVK